jgi:hypothetical protein
MLVKFVKWIWGTEILEKLGEMREDLEKARVNVSMLRSLVANSHRRV